MLDLNPQFMLKNLLQSVISVNSQAAISNAVDEKLDRVLFAMEYHNEKIDVLTVHHLQAFIKAVNSQRTRKLDDTQAELLINQADSILSKFSH